jgi:16S rRNA (cytosine1402-N4)-methyltransferase
MNEHIPVLLKETIDELHLKEGETVLDGTINTGGHSLVICSRIGRSGHLIGIDRDGDALAIAKERLAMVQPKITLLEGNFRDMNTLCASVGVTEVDAILLDIGLSNRQLFNSQRGFSFQNDEPLMMTFNAHPKDGELTAEEIVNEWDEENLADIIFGYGEERSARSIAKAIVKARAVSRITSTLQLAEIIKESTPIWRRKKKIHPATQTFQALRITVNDELGALKEGIEKAVQLLKPDGRLAIITFHSGEDRIVKHTFKQLADDGIVRIKTKKPIVPTEEENIDNPKARSSKLRIIEKM